MNALQLGSVAILSLFTLLASAASEHDLYCKQNDTACHKSVDRAIKSDDSKFIKHSSIVSALMCLKNSCRKRHIAELIYKGGR